MKNITLKYLSIFIIAVIVFGLVSCSADKPKQLNNDGSIRQVTVLDYPFPYNLKEPDQVNYLDRKLVEISGLSLTSDTSQLVCVNDEIGRLFYMSKKSGKILSSIEFGEYGDYEGLEFVNGKYYVVNNSGTLFSFDPVTNESTIENTFLTSANDVEGLGYWPKKNRLLLACKGSPSGKNKYENSRAIYDFDLQENKLKKKPMFLITKEKVEDFIGAKSVDGLSEKLLKRIHIHDALSFAPSGIAVHPISQHIYILSSQGNTLFVVDKKGTILHISFLSKTKFKKPEGIVFDVDGTMYISNEGKQAKASLMKFKYLGR